MQTVLSGILLGAFIFLVVVGFCWVRDTLGFYNMAHGEFVSVGAYTFWIVFQQSGNAILATLAAMLIAGAVGVAVERVFFRPLRRTSTDALLLTSFGVAVLLRVIISLTFSSASRGLGLEDPVFFIGAFRLFLSEAIGVILAVLLLGLMVVLNRTRFGLAARALGENVPWLGVHGIPVDSIIAKVFFLSAATGGIGGVLLSWRFTLQVSFFPYILYAFVISVASRGSFGNVFGASTALGLLLAVSGRIWDSPLAAEAFATVVLMLIFTGLWLLRRSGNHAASMI